MTDNVIEMQGKPNPFEPGEGPSRRNLVAEVSYPNDWAKAPSIALVERGSGELRSWGWAGPFLEGDKIRLNATAHGGGEIGWLVKLTEDGLAIAPVRDFSEPDAFRWYPRNGVFSVSAAH
jgi:hypothetical protein